METDNHPTGPVRLHKQSASCHGYILTVNNTYQAAPYNQNPLQL